MTPAPPIHEQSLDPSRLRAAILISVFYERLCRKAPRAKFWRNFSPTWAKKCGEKMAKIFADFRPSISRKSGRKKFHEKLATNSAGRKFKLLSLARLWEFGGTRTDVRSISVGFFSILRAIEFALSGPVLRDTARLSQRYPPIARYGVFDVSTWPIGCDTPSPLFRAFPHWRACKVEVRYPPSKGVSQRYLRDTLKKQGKNVRYPPLRYYLERVLRDTGGYLALGR